LSGTIKTVFDSEGLRPADYFARATILADDYTLYANTSFKVGTLDVKIKDYTKELKTGGIKRFLISAESGWNDPIPIFSDVRIYDANKSTISRSATVTLSPWQTAEMESYIDTEGLEPKEYDLHIDVNFADRKVSVDDKILLTEGTNDTIIIEMPSSAEPGIFNTKMMAFTIVLVIIVVILTLLNIMLMVRRKKNDEK
jgi:hypothetical protein